MELSFTTESRAFCNNCDFLKSRCLCDTLKTLPNRLHLVVLQHPSETKHPLNTVRIMKKSFQAMTVMIGEDFSENLEFMALINNPQNRCALLYPDLNSVVLSNESQHAPITHLILIDGTWRKAKKIFMLSKNLHKLHTIRLAPPEKSDYRIRKSPSENALSTLEAAALALEVLEPKLDTTPAILSFKKMINLQIKKMGREIYQTNYLDKKKES